MAAWLGHTYIIELTVASGKRLCVGLESVRPSVRLSCRTIAGKRLRRYGSISAGARQKQRPASYTAIRRTRIDTDLRLHVLHAVLARYLLSRYVRPSVIISRNCIRTAERIEQVSAQRTRNHARTIADKQKLSRIWRRPMQCIQTFLINAIKLTT